mmetsp:Transcript_71663/g.202312  ORF Transcript_71663/g.202312 Transcript_71663/m.202312 type:complete len:305 (+) Transcript_71663:507-1421(+)
MATATVGTRAAEQFRISVSLFSGAFPSDCSFSSAYCRIWRCIVGTAEYHVGSGAATSAEWKFCTWKMPGTHLICDPSTAEDSTFTMSPWMWKRGIVLLQTSSGFCPTVDAMQRAPQVMFACVRGTIFGFLVVPDVWSTRAIWSRATVSIGLPMASPFSGFPAACFASSKRPANSLSGVSSSNFSTLVFLATLTALPEFFWPSSSRESLFCTTRAFAGRSVNSKSNSSRLKAMLKGANWQRSANAKKQTAASGPFGIAVQRRSSRPRPSTSTLSLTMNAFSCFRLIGFRPSVEWRNGVSRSGIRS